MQPKTYKLTIPNDDYAGKWKLTWLNEKGEEFSHRFAYKHESKELIQSLEDNGYTKVN